MIQIAAHLIVNPSPKVATMTNRTLERGALLRSEKEYIIHKNRINAESVYIQHHLGRSLSSGLQKHDR